ncbi:GTP-binding protein, partial [Salmonella enterica subsp. enterica serovar Virchow]|nr:GTP-binding protein [Salmonella enterica subsp. enterica serovar Virchow]
MRSFEPIAVSVLTGFLGAGKTTLLNRLLRSPELTDTAVIINEFGDVSIDHLLVEQSSDGVIELADGCLCCTVRGELVDTLADLVDRLQTGKIERLSRVVIETTGLADPVPVLQSIMGHPVLAQAYRLDGVITVVDAVNCAATLDRHEEAVKQVAVADRLVLTKTDLVDAADLRAVEQRLRTLNPGAVIMNVDQADVAALFNAGLYDPATKSADVGRWLGAAHGHDHDDHHHHGHDHDHDHHHHAHDGRVRSFSLTHDRPVPYASLEMFLELLRSVHGDQLLRMKGVVQLAEQPDRPVVVHGVQKLLHPIGRLPAWPEGKPETRLVIIGFDLAEEHVRRLFAAITDQPGIDQPDSAAVRDNPL